MKGYMSSACFDLGVVCVGVHFFLLLGLLDRSGSRSELVFYWQESGEADFLQSKQSFGLKLFTGQVAHVFTSTYGKRVTLEWKMELFTQSSL